jgi:hypothetical protein
MLGGRIETARKGSSVCKTLEYWRPSAVDPGERIGMTRLVCMTAIAWGCLLAVVGLMNVHADTDVAKGWIVCVVLPLSPCTLVFAVLGLLKACEIRRERRGTGTITVLICLSMNAIIAVGLPVYLLSVMLWTSLG